jgi:hypothetical protein
MKLMTLFRRLKDNMQPDRAVEKRAKLTKKRVTYLSFASAACHDCHTTVPTHVLNKQSPSLAQPMDQHPPMT